MTNHAKELAPHSEALRTWLVLVRKSYARRISELCPQCAAQEFVSRLFDEAVAAAIAAEAPPQALVEMLVAAWNTQMEAHNAVQQ